MRKVLLHHGHEHGCGHEHEHHHSEENEHIALLAYMHHHNEHHLEEFLETYEAVKDNEKAGKALKEGIELLRQANEKFAQAIAALKEG